MMDVVAEPGVSTVESSTELARTRRRAGLLVLAPSLPALLAIVLLVIMPLGWLAWLSFFDGQGKPTIENYARLVETTTYLRSFETTIKVSFTVTFACILFGYPLAYLMSELTRRRAALLMFAVLLPYWTSILVRTYAWMIILQRRGIINNLLIGSGIIDEPLRLVNNFTGTVIGMVHIMLPFFILPLYGAMLRIDRTYMMAAASLGTRPSEAFRRVFLPLSIPGVLAGAFLVFVLSIGFYVTPAILGGGRVIMIAQEMEQTISLYANWGAAGALGVALLLLTSMVLILAALVARLLAKAGRS
jgi:ABC-type spermidine/putrescine transport system permease subunit I